MAQPNDRHFDSSYLYISDGQILRLLHIEQESMLLHQSASKTKLPLLFHYLILIKIILADQLD